MDNTNHIAIYDIVHNTITDNKQLEELITCVQIICSLPLSVSVEEYKQFEIDAPDIIIELVKKLIQARKDSEWLAYQLEKASACCPPKGIDCNTCNRLDCIYTSHTSWLKAVQERI